MLKYLTCGDYEDGCAGRCLTSLASFLTDRALAMAVVLPAALLTHRAHAMAFVLTPLLLASWADAVFVVLPALLIAHRTNAVVSMISAELIFIGHASILASPRSSNAEQLPARSWLTSTGHGNA